MVDSTKCIGVTAVVEYDYTAKEPDELDLIKGAFIHSIKQMPGGWWEGTLLANGKVGMFPDNFVRVVDMNEDNTVVLRDKMSTNNRRCKVIYSYTQVNEDELSLAVGDVIEFLGEVEEGWWRGRLHNKIGVFPSNFVKVIEPSPVFASKRPPSIAKTGPSKAGNMTSASIGAASAISSSSVCSTTASSSTNSTTQKKTNRLSFHSSKEDLLNSMSATTTSSTISASSTSVREDAATPAPLLPPKPQRDFCRVEFPYAPQNEDELELKVGDIITIHSMDLPDKGWWKGELRGKVGVFPDNFVKLLASTEVSPLNDTQQSQPQQTHRTAKTSNLSTTNNLATVAGTAGSSASSTAVKTLIKKSGSSSSTQSSNPKDSFGSRDSLNDILSETGLPTGNVAAQRKSLENKNLDLTNAADIGSRLAFKKQQQQQVHMHQETKTLNNTSNNNSNSTTAASSSSPMLAGSSSELRKSVENMDDKTKTTPPPVINKKPTVPAKKTTTVTSITGNILSGIKQKVKNVEHKLTTAASHDYADGIGSSKLSPGGVASDNSGVVMRRAATIAADSDFDRVERGSILQDMRAGRVKAPKRRPPSTAISTVGESNNNSLYVNGNGSDTTQSGDDQLKSDDNSTGEEQLAKPKPREWEKKKAPWMEELKASQVKKKTPTSVDTSGTSSSATVAERTSKLFGEDVKITNQSMASTNSSSTNVSSSTKVQSSSVSSTSVMQQSMIVECSTSNHHSNVSHKSLSEAMTKSLSAKMANETTAALAASSPANTFSNNNSSTLASTVPTMEDVRVRPNSLSIRNRSASPSLTASRNIAKSSSHNTTNSATSAEASNSHSQSNNSSTHTTTTSSSSTTNTTTTTIKNTSNTAAVVNNHHHNHQLDNGTASASTVSSKAVVDTNRIVDLETRIEKLEMLVHSQQLTIDELVRTLREESDRNKVLRAELDKYAQCVTQV